MMGIDVGVGKDYTAATVLFRCPVAKVTNVHCPRKDTICVTVTITYKEVEIDMAELTKEVREAILFQDCLRDEIVLWLYRASLAPRMHCHNQIGVYQVDEKNEFDGRDPLVSVDKPEVVFLGYIHLQGDVTLFGPDETSNEYIKLEFADPNFHRRLLRFYGVSEDRITSIFESRLSDEIVSGTHDLQKSEPTSGVPA